jgi:hypothetical protein
MRVLFEKGDCMNFATKLAAIAVVSGIAAAAGANVPAKNVAAQGPGPSEGLAVRVVDPLPLPTTGTSTVSGVVASTQSGAWDIGIVGTPTVLARNLDEPGRAPFQEETQVPAQGSCDSEFCGSTYQFTKVPAGKRLVITDVSVYMTTKKDAVVLPVTLTSGFLQQMHLPISRQASPLVFGAYCTAAAPCEAWVMHEQLHYYAEPESIPAIHIGLDSAHDVPIFKSVSMHGYYVSLP